MSTREVFWPICFSFLGSLASGAPALAQTPSEEPFRPDYVIRVRVDPDEKRLAGAETLTWTNQSKDEVFDLWFHLYWNAFANNRSTHLVESGGELRGTKIADEWGWQRITSLRVNGGDSMARVEWMAPDDGNALDRSVFRVKLTEPAKQGDVVTVEIEWEAQPPRLRRRTGQKGDFLFMAQWFPKLGVYETGNGWNCHQFHASTEFFADFGTYDVTIDLPQRYAGRIGASGVEVGLGEAAQGGGTMEALANGRVRARFLAPSEADRALVDATGKRPLVHDFTWTAEPRFVKYEDVFRWKDWAGKFDEEVSRTGLALGRSKEELAGRDVRVTVLLQPEHEQQGWRHFDATCTALFFYGLWWGTYPYEHVTVVDPAWGGGAAGGMEYPTLFTAGTRMFTFPTMRTPESVTVHECGHQFWYGLVGNNEFEAGWLDEGFNTYSQNEAMARRYGMNAQTSDYGPFPIDAVSLLKAPGGGIGDWLALKSGPRVLGVDWVPVKASGLVDWWRDQPHLAFGRLRDDPRSGDRNGYLADPASDAVDTPGWMYVDGRSYRTNSYRRTATMLRTLCGLVGEEKFQKGMRLYSERWRYKHPYGDDFFAAFQEGAGVDVGWYFESAFRSRAVVDWSVNVTQKRSTADAGWFMNPSGVWERKEVDRGVAQDRDEPGAQDPGEQEESKGSQSGKRGAPSGEGDAPGSGWIADVVVRRTGEFALPLELELAWEGGEKEKLVWTREEQLRTAWWKPLKGRKASEKKLVSAVIDPGQRYWLDTNLANNRWYVERDVKTPVRWAERVFAHAAQVLHWFGGVGG